MTDDELIALAGAAYAEHLGNNTWDIEAIEAAIAAVRGKIEAQALEWAARHIAVDASRNYMGLLRSSCTPWVFAADALLQEAARRQTKAPTHD